MEQTTKTKTAVTVGEAASIDKAFAPLLGLDAPVDASAQQTAAWTRLSFRILEAFQQTKPCLKAVSQAREAVFRRYGEETDSGLSIAMTSPRFAEFTETLATLDASDVASWPNVVPFRKEEFIDAGVAPKPIVFIQMGPLYAHGEVV